VIGAEHPRHAGVAGQLVALVDGRDIDCIPARQQRGHGETFARRDGAGQDLVTIKRQLLRLLAGDLRLGFAIEYLDLDFMAGDAAFSIGLRRRELDGSHRLGSEAGIGAGERGWHTDLQGLLGER
jgi:hypothetical protein